MSGLNTTLDVLAQTKNEAAVPVLLAALDAPHLNVQAGAIHALLKRRGSAGPRALIKRWHRLSERWKNAASEKVGRITGAIRDAILSGDEQLVKNGCDAVLWISEYDLLPTLVNAALDRSNPYCDLASETVVSLCESLCEALASPRDYRNRRDPQSARRNAVGALERVADHYEQHKNKLLLEAFVMLVNRENSVLRRVLQHPHDPAYTTIMRLLAHSHRPGVMRLLLNYLDDADAPSSIFSVLARRSDVTFVRHFLKRFGGGVRSTARQHLKRIESFGWLRDGAKILSALSEQEQRGALELAMTSGISRLDAFEVIRAALESVHPGTRRFAAECLGEFRGADANELILETVDDDDPAVQAHVAGLLREHSIPGAITKLLQLLVSPHESVQQAARENLSEFSLKRFVTAYDRLDEDTRRERGALVKRVDPGFVASLRAELQSEERSQRIRALQVAITIDATREVEDELVEMLSDTDDLVRLKAVLALQACGTDTCRAALHDALLDPNDRVGQAAQAALEEFGSSSLATEPGSVPTFELDALTDPPGTEGAAL